MYTNRYIDFCLLDFNLVKCELKPSVHLSSCHTLAVAFSQFSHPIYYMCLCCVYFIQRFFQPMTTDVRCCSPLDAHAPEKPKKAVKMENCFTTHQASVVCAPRFFFQIYTTTQR